MNNQLHNNATKKQIKEESITWLTYLYCGEIEPYKLTEFKVWLNSSEQHKSAFIRSEQVWENIGLVDSVVEWATEITDRDSVIAIHSNNEKENNRCATSPSKKRISFLSVHYLKNIAATLILVLLAAFLIPILNQTEVIPKRYASNVAQNLIVKLSDGSKVTLAGNSAILVNISQHQRKIVLEKGSAYFEVIRDASRVFLVIAAHTQVSVKGTAFEVRHNTDTIRVSVTRGIVTVADLPSQGKINPQIEQLTAGEQILAQNNGRFIGNKVNFDKNAALAWLVGRFVFDSTPLKDVVEDLNRYYHKTIIIHDDKIKNLQITTSIQFDQIEKMLTGLTAAYPIFMTKQNNQIVLSAKPL